MTPIEIYMYALLAKNVGYITNIWHHMKCNDRCESCPAGPVCEYLATIEPYENFNKAFEALFLPYRDELEHLTLNDIHKTHPELFI